MSFYRRSIYTSLLVLWLTLPLFVTGWISCQSNTSVSGGDGGHQNVNQNQGGDASSPADAAPPDAAVQASDPHLVSGLSVDRVELYQAVQIPLYADGAPVGAGARNAPVVAGREAVVRVYVTPTGGWSPRQVRAELFVGPVGARPFDPQDPAFSQSLVVTDTRSVAGASSEASLESTFVLRLPATQVSASPAMAWAVRLVDPAEADPEVPAGTSHPARVPPDGLGGHALEAQTDLPGIDLVLVPLRYDRDGSGRLPDTSPTQLGLIETLLTNLYPASQVTITVHDAIPWDEALTWTGNFNFGSLNGTLMDLRVSDNASDRAYYYGLVCPDDTFAAYCGSSCVTGQSYVVDEPEYADYRVGGGVGFTGEDSVWTLAHELGHMHGRDHAPCEVSSSDPGYPYNGGLIGVYGMDLRATPAPLLSPTVYADLMGYCDDTWISDYTYGALFQRIVAVNALPPPPLPVPPLPVPPAPGISASRTPSVTLPIGRYRLLSLSPDSAPAWGRHVRSRTARLTRERYAIVFLDRRGREIGRALAAAVRSSHGRETHLFVPEPFPAGASEVRLPEGLGVLVGPTGAGRPLPLPR